MGFSRKLQYFLVHQLGWTNKRARAAIKAGDLSVNGTVVLENCLLSENDEIKNTNEILRSRKHYLYFKFYKPRGCESSLHAKVPNNISAYFENARQLAIAGRLDKDSEGLLLLSNDGKWVEEMCNPKQEKEKEYLVELAQMPNLAFVNQFENGVLLGGDYKTKPCSCEIIEGTTIKVILKEGKNRQIRRMCHKLGYTVVSLLRTRINDQMLNELNPGQVEQFFPKEAD